MNTLKATVRWGVLTFVLIAGAVTFAGLDPAAKAEAESIAVDQKITVGQKAESTSLTSVKKKIILTAESNSTG